MLTFSEIEQKFQSSGLEQSWRDALAESGLPDADRERILGKMQESWQEFTEAAGMAEDGNEVKKAVANRYIELKSHWQLMNAQIQYRMFLEGVGDDRLAYNASLMSSLTGFFGDLLGADEVAVINRFLADPLRKELGEFMPDLEQVSSAVVNQESLEEQLTDLYAEKAELREALGTSDNQALIGLVGSLEEQLDDLNQEREDLQETLGVSRSEDVKMLVASMDEQLRDLYEEMENAIIVEGKKVTIVGPRKIIVRKKRP